VRLSFDHAIEADPPVPRPTAGEADATTAIAAATNTHRLPFTPSIMLSA
jgi:hypothetical protein